MKIVEKAKETWEEKKDTIIGVGLMIGGVGILIGGLVAAKYINDMPNEDALMIDCRNAPVFTLNDCGELGRYLIEHHHVNPDFTITNIMWKIPE